MDPLVSIIIPVYNRPFEFERALKSALAQDYSNIEIIIVDDGSTEDIETVVEKYIKNTAHRQIRYIKQENMGPGIARKTGLETAKGDFIQYLDADDVLDQRKIKLQVNALLGNPSSVVCIAKKKPPSSTDLLELTLNAKPWPISATLWRYPCKDYLVWPPLSSGEDIVHFVSVGIHTREITWIDDDLVKVYYSINSHSKTSKIGSKRMRRLSENFQYPLLVEQMMRDSGLIKYKKYSEPLAERLYRVAFQFAMIGERESAITLLRSSFHTSQLARKKLEVIIAYLAILFTNSRLPTLYILLFKIHRKINPRLLHADKYITLFTH